MNRVMGEMGSFFTELKRRNVFKVAVAYAIVSWLLIQITDIVAPALHLPDWTLTFIVYLLIIGFPLALFLSWAFELTPEGIKVTSSQGPDKFHTHTTGQQLNYTIIGVLILAVIFLVVDNYMLEGDKHEETEVSGEETPVRSEVGGVRSEVLPNSIAVLPFDNLSPDPDNAYFAAGIHDTILNELAKIGDINVISRTTMLRYAGSDKTIDEIADELNVETVMEGSVQYAEGRVLVTAQLIDPKTNAHLWSKNYDREFKGIFALQADIASNIAIALEAELLPAERANIEKPMTNSPEAYALYLRAVASVADLGPFGFGISKDLHRFLDQAIAIDPDFARAYALKAVDYVSAIIRPAKLSEQIDRAELERLAVENAQRALSIDPGMGLAYDVLAQVHWFNWQGTQAEEYFKKALALSPNDYDVRVDYAIFLAEFGRSRESIPIAEPLLNISPGFGHYVLGKMYWYVENYDKAMPLLREASALVPSFPFDTLELAISEAAMGNKSEALRNLRIVEGLWQDVAVEPAFLAMAAYTYSRIGRPEDAQRMVDRLDAMSAEYTVGPGSWALAYLAMGDEENALIKFNQAADLNGYDDSYSVTGEFSTTTDLDPRLEQPEFVEVLNRLGPK